MRVVAFARLFFPTEAKLAIDIAHAETTSPYAGRLASSGSSGNLREVDLNETPLMRQKRLQSRVEALLKTGIFSKILIQLLLAVTPLRMIIPVYPHSKFWSYTSK